MFDNQFLPTFSLKPMVLNLFSLRTSKISKQILRTGEPTKSTKNVISTKFN